MNIETLEKANELQEEIDKVEFSLRRLSIFEHDEITVRRKRYVDYVAHYDFVCEVDDELKKIIEERLISKKERLEKELEEL